MSSLVWFCICIFFFFLGCFWCLYLKNGIFYFVYVVVFCCSYSFFFVSFIFIMEMCVGMFLCLFGFFLFVSSVLGFLKKKCINFLL